MREARVRGDGGGMRKGVTVILLACSQVGDGGCSEGQEEEERRVAW